MAQEVYDVSGAGDTVIGTLAVMMAAGADLHAAMRIANHAAGIVVAKLGTAVATRAELVASLAHHP
jgi:bifunctional ADP-heptose synthase (sugar kinase/adenylyltransferase)